MTLVDVESDDKAILVAEDAAVLAEDETNRTIPTGQELALLIEALSDEADIQR